MFPQPNQPDQELEREVADALDRMSTEELMAMAASHTPAPTAATGRVTGRILRISAADVFVDVGGKSEGFLSLDEFPADAAPQVGQELTFVAHGIDRDSGMVRLSLRDVLLDANWDSLRAGEVVEGRVTGMNRGGLEIDIHGIRGFIPAGQASLEPMRDISLLLGQKIEVEVTEADRGARRLVLSRRRLQERRREEARAQLRYTLKEGQVRDGVVRRLADFGAFVDLGGMDGLLHISDIGYGRIKHPSEMLKVGDKVTVKVLKFDLVTDRISLGLKQLAEDPWHTITERIKVGDVVQGRVTRLMNFGAFVEVHAGIEGLIPLSEVSYTRRVGHPRELLKEDDAVQAAVLALDPENRKLTLSLKRLGADPWTTVAERYKPNETVSGVVTRAADFGAFIQLEDGVEGMAHISELSDRRVLKVTEAVKIGQVVSARILGVDAEKRRISLSLKSPPVATPQSEAPQPHSHAAPPHKKRARPLRGGLD